MKKSGICTSEREEKRVAKLDKLSMPLQDVIDEGLEAKPLPSKRGGHHKRGRRSQPFASAKGVTS